MPSEPEVGTAQPMSNQDIVNTILTENDTQDKSDDESEEEIPSAIAIKNFYRIFGYDRSKESILKTKSNAHRYC